jgi:hypothetical protein
MAPGQRMGGLRNVFPSGTASSSRGGWQRHRNTVYRAVASFVLLAAVVVAAASEANAPREYLDEETGATVFYVGRPLVFARERTTVNGRLAVRESAVASTHITQVPRDYVTLAAAAVDRGGKYTYVVLGYFWFVSAPEPDENACFNRERLVLQLGERRIELAPFDGSARDAGISQPIHQPSIGDAKPTVYPIDLATLGQIAESAHPVLYCEVERASLKYQLLEDRLPAVRELLRHLSD